MKYIFIDIRQSNEVYSKRFGESDHYTTYNIPMNMIRFNQKTIIDHLDYIDEIYIVCRSAKRSQFIKDKYFANWDKIKVDENLQFSKLQPGMNKVNLNDNKTINVNVVGTNSYNLYNILFITQIILGSIVLILSLYMHKDIRKKNTHYVPLIILMCVGAFALYNGLTGSCILSSLLRDHLN